MAKKIFALEETLPKQAKEVFVAFEEYLHSQIDYSTFLHDKNNISLEGFFDVFKKKQETKEEKLEDTIEGFLNKLKASSAHSGTVSNTATHDHIFNLGSPNKVLQVLVELNALLSLIKHQSDTEVSNYKALYSACKQFAADKKVEHIRKAHVQDIVPAAIPCFHLTDEVRKYKSGVHTESVLISDSKTVVVYCNTSMKNKRVDRSKLDDLTLMESIGASWIRWEKMGLNTKDAGARNNNVSYTYEESESIRKAAIALSANLVSWLENAKNNYDVVYGIAEELSDLHDRTITEMDEDSPECDLVNCLDFFSDEICHEFGKFDFYYETATTQFIKSVVSAFFV